MELSKQVIAKLRTTSELKAVLVCLEEFVASFFAPHEHENLLVLFEQLPNGAGSVLKEVFFKAPITPENENALKKQVEKLQEELNECKRIQITLAFQPDNVTIEFLSDWIKKNATADTLIDLHYDRTIIGGLQLVANGIYKDYSLRKTLSNKFQLQKADIEALIT